MSYNGSGTFLINSTGQPVISGTVISSSTFNALTADLANGLSTAITKDGQTTITSNIPLNNFKITNLGAGTASTDAVRLGQLQAGTATAITVTGTDTYTGTMSPVLSSYTAGNTFSFIVPNTNTTSCTLNIDGQGAKAITRDGSTALIAGDLVAGSEVVVIYDGTRFQVINSNSKTNFNLSGNLTVAGSATLSGGTANGVAYLNGSKVFTTGSALTFDGTNLGIGTSSPAAKLDVVGSARFYTDSSNVDVAINRQGNGIFNPTLTMWSGYSATNVSQQWSIDTNGCRYSYLNILRFVDSGASNAERMRIDSSGNVGIGTASPGAKLGVYMPSSPGGTPGIKVTMSGGGASTGYDAVGIDVPITLPPNSDTIYGVRSVISGGGTGQQSYAGYFKAISGNSYISNTAVYAELNSSGATGLYGNTYAVYAYANNISSGTTGFNWALTGATNNTSNAFSLYLNDGYTTAGTKTLAQFDRGGSTVGSISTTLSATSFNTSSDYRLKDKQQPLTGSGAFIDALKPKTWEWKADGSKGVGFIAHEVAEVSPSTVVGEKDAVDADGKPIYQSMEYGSAEFIANIVAELQSLRARVAQLESA